MGSVLPDTFTTPVRACSTAASIVSGGAVRSTAS
ncbi:Uncharacterised protein [Bordetella pertussis]|nr:Uncharacterised protein [Bordetella pertussis]